MSLKKSAPADSNSRRALLIYRRMYQKQSAGEAGLCVGSDSRGTRFRRLTLPPCREPSLVVIAGALELGLAAHVDAELL